MATKDDHAAPNWDQILGGSTGATELRDSLLVGLRGYSALPFLFVGSGISRRFLGLPDWVGLLRVFADEINADLDYFLATAGGKPPGAASLLAEKYHHAWFSDPKYKTLRDAHRSEVLDDEAAQKVAIATFVEQRSKLDNTRPGLQDPDLHLEIQRMRDSVVDGVITTNYDQLLEQIFGDFTTYIGQDQLLLSDAQFVAEIYKIHGSSTQPNSLILTDRDYSEFTERNVYLAAKLLTIFAEHPVIFLGYSLSDAYIREIISSIARAVGSSRLNDLSDRIYFVEWERDPAKPPAIDRIFMDVQGGSLPMTRVKTHTLLPVFDALAKLERPFPAKVLRELRKHVFDLVAHPEPGQARESVVVVPLDSQDAPGLRVVFGVGEFSDDDVDTISSIGFRTLTRDDLARDTLQIRARGIDPQKVLTSTLPELLRVASKSHLPVWKYVTETQVSSAARGATPMSLSPEVEALCARTPEPQKPTLKRFANNHQSLYKTPRELFASNLAVYYKFDALLCLDENEYELEELRIVLAEEFEKETNHTAPVRTFLFKAIAYYDRLRWAPSTPAEVL